MCNRWKRKQETKETTQYLSEASIRPRNTPQKKAATREPHDETAPQKRSEIMENGWVMRGDGVFGNGAVQKCANIVDVDKSMMQN